MPSAATHGSDDRGWRPRPRTEDPALAAQQLELPGDGGGARGHGAAAGGQHGRTRLTYPVGFRVLLLATSGVAALWLLHFFLLAHPAMRVDMASPCVVTDQQLERGSFWSVELFLLVVVIRILLHTDRCFGRIRQQAECGAMGPLRRYPYALAVHGSHYMFCVSSAMFAAHLISMDSCEAHNPALHWACRRSAGGGVLVALSSASLALWRGELLRRAASPGPEKWGEALGPLGGATAAVPYDPALFGDEDGRPFAGHCPICLGVWGAEDDIRLTPCGHAFHGGCLGQWLRSKPTCALCRRNITAPVAPSDDVDLEAATAPSLADGSRPAEASRLRAEVQQREGRRAAGIAAI